MTRFALPLVLALTGCHQLYPEAKTSLRAAETQMLSAYDSTDPDLRKAHERVAFCNIENVARMYGVGTLATGDITCLPARTP